jgi:hypothetical protein
MELAAWLEDAGVALARILLMKLPGALRRALSESAGVVFSSNCSSLVLVA